MKIKFLNNSKLAQNQFIIKKVVKKVTPLMKQYSKIKGKYPYA